MSTLGDVLEGIRKTVLLQDSVSRLEKRIETVTQDLVALKDVTVGVDKRVVRIETMIEMSGRGPAQSRIEG